MIRYYFIIALLVIVVLPLYPQVENVPAHHRVYEFLHRMEVRGVLDKYHGTVLPLSRKIIGRHLSRISEKRERLTRSERELLDLYRLEFSYDLGYGVIYANELFGNKQFSKNLRGIFSQKQKYLYFWHDPDDNSLFLNGLGALEHRNRSGDHSAQFSFAEIGIRSRGTLGGRVGYYLDIVNGIAFGDSSFALEDPRFLTNYTFRVVGDGFYDESTGYIRFATDWFGLQIGRERLLWRENYGNSIFLSSNPPMFDFIRFDASYGVVTYNFIHGWLLGPLEMIWYSDEHAPYPFHDAKYGVFHRLEFSLFNNVLRVGLNESLIYTRNSPEIGYLNPVSFLISTERNLGDRDRLMLGIDFAVKPGRNIELKFGAVIDDLNLKESLTRSWDNRWAVHGGLYYIDPFGIRNVDLFIDYTRIEPYMYTHHRSPDRYYAHNDFVLGHPLGPNSDETTMKVIYKPNWQWRIATEFKRKRHGENVVDDEGNVIENVGGDFLFPWRLHVDPMTKEFLAGELRENYIFRTSIEYEIFRQIKIVGLLEWDNLIYKNENYNNFKIGFGITLEY